MAHKRTLIKSSPIEKNDDDMALRISPVSLNVCDENRGHSIVAAKTSSNANAKKRRPASHATSAAPVEEHSSPRLLVSSQSRVVPLEVLVGRGIEAQVGWRVVTHSFTHSQQEHEKLQAQYARLNALKTTELDKVLASVQVANSHRDDGTCDVSVRCAHSQSRSRKGCVPAAAEYIATLKDENAFLRDQYERALQKIAAYEALVGITMADSKELQGHEELRRDCLRCVITGKPSKPPGSSEPVVPSLHFDLLVDNTEGFVAYFPVGIEEHLESRLPEYMLEDIEVECAEAPIFALKLLKEVNRQLDAGDQDQEEHEQEQEDEMEHEQPNDGAL